jgi:predicted Zn-ribbon and HTH transcriptional regulator
MNTTSRLSEITAANAALRRSGGSYLLRHSVDIAKRAVMATSEEEACRSVEHLVGGTSVGRRNYAKWAHIARAAASKTVIVEDVPFECSSCGETHSNTTLERTGGKCPKAGA